MSFGHVWGPDFGAGFDLSITGRKGRWAWKYPPLHGVRVIFRQTPAGQQWWYSALWDQCCPARAEFAWGGKCWDETGFSLVMVQNAGKTHGISATLSNLPARVCSMTGSTSWWYCEPAVREPSDRYFSSCWLQICLCSHLIDLMIHDEL